LRRSLRGEPRNDLLASRIRTYFDFRPHLILNRMRNVDRVKLGPAKRGGLRARRCHKRRGRYRDRRDPPSFQLQRVVQTARCAGPSIRQTLDHGVGTADRFENFDRGWLGEGGLHRANHSRYPVLFAKQ